MCTIPPSTLSFEDASRPRKVHLLDCSNETESKVQQNVIKTDVDTIWDMCSIEHFDEGLAIVLTTGGKEVTRLNNAYVRWTIAGTLPGRQTPFRPHKVAVDKQGHLFVNDSEQYIQMFSVSDSQYLGCLLQEGEQGLGRPWLIRLLEVKSQLVVIHKKHENNFIAIFDVQ